MSTRDRRSEVRWVNVLQRSARAGTNINMRSLLVKKIAILWASAWTTCVFDWQGPCQDRTWTCGSRTRIFGTCRQVLATSPENPYANPAGTCGLVIFFQKELIVRLNILTSPQVPAGFAQGFSGLVARTCRQVPKIPAREPHVQVRSWHGPLPVKHACSPGKGPHN